MNVTEELRSVTRTRKLLNAMLWLIVLGAIFYSLMTSTPLVSAHSHWAWSGWALGALTDAAFILSISADAVLSRHGISSGRWPTAFRWVTGLASLFLNTWSSVAERDWVGVAIHAIAPAILICAAEVAPIYRRKFRDLETALNALVTEEKVTQLVTPKRVTRNKKESVVTVTPLVTAPVTGPLVTAEEKEVTKEGLSVAKQGIRDAYLEGLSATEAAKKVGKSRPYVSKVYKEIREGLGLTA
ncbi:peptidase C14 [Streptomyces sp. ScaeMP-e48]|uniref:peptidase C14 n=1 Tax=Streptomyces sp. ScaeMP-e48 TaxID=1100823 RepID=UPI00117C1E10|nr:peptidase C14 [Streptomyces sp. ScaeMP-e48]